MIFFLYHSEDEPEGFHSIYIFHINFISIGHLDIVEYSTEEFFDSPPFKERKKLSNIILSTKQQNAQEAVV